ncbi:MAG: hypothetical protein PF440_07840 [Thiomicrorhabdus sp.]|jgi:hypothetical protein|nr:hypothetical protein [Thiomicrorhabdus sp.]
MQRVIEVKNVIDESVLNELIHHPSNTMVEVECQSGTYTVQVIVHSAQLRGARKWSDNVTKFRNQTTEQ